MSDVLAVPETVEYGTRDFRRYTVTLLCQIPVPESNRMENIMLIGYARVSTPDQKLDLQVDDLKRAGCAEVFSDVASGARDARPGLSKTLDRLQNGDTLVVWRLDRLGRSLPHLVSTVNELAARGVEFRSVRENIDTTTAGGRLVFHMFAALAEFEKELIHERTRAGLSAARARGRVGGRARMLSAEQVEIAARLAKDDVPVAQICGVLKISRRSYFRYMSRRAGGSAT